MSLAIVCRDLKKTYPGKPPVEAVRGIDLEVQEGECFGVLGPNGAGKTTTIEILEGLLDPSSGDVEVLGMSWAKDAMRIRQSIGISLQETQLSDKLTVIETLRLFRSFYAQGVAPEEALRRVSLDEKADTWIRKLSGGQKQRLAVATALVGDPRLLFLDEPTTGLDPSSRRELWDIIRSFGEQGRAVLLTTHYMDEAEKLCDRVAIVDRGKIIALGTPRELIAGLGGEHVIEFSLRRRSAELDEPRAGPKRGAGMNETEGETTGVEGASAVQQWQSLPAVSSAQRTEDGFVLSSSQPHVTIPALLEQIHGQQQQLAGLTTRAASLEDVFVSLTGRHLDEHET